MLEIEQWVGTGNEVTGSRALASTPLFLFERKGDKKMLEIE
jgi:hypothetical protein